MRPQVFFVAQAILIALGVVWAIGRSSELEARRALPPLRPEPLALEPLHDEPSVVSDEQLRRVLSRLGVRFRGAETSVGHADHLLRTWGARADLSARGLMTGGEMLRLLLDHGRFQEVYGGGEAPLLIDEGDGVRVRVGEGTASSAHTDHLLATLAEIGTSLDQQVVTASRRTTYRALLEQSLRDFSLNQAEYEWSALTYALFLRVDRWRTSEGQEVTFDRLAERLMRERVPNGVCSANHRLYALAAFLRADARVREERGAPMLSADARDRVTSFLHRMTETLVRHQHPQGFWNFDWPAAAPAAAEPSEREGDRPGDRLIATGHALEWWALAPAELTPPVPVASAAGQWLVSAVDALSDDEIQRYGSYLSHVGRALAAWRGRLPADVELAP